MRLHLARSVAVGLICCCSLLAAVPGKPKYALVLQAPPATSVDSVAVSPDGSLVATAGGEGGVRLYNAKTGELLRTIGEVVGDRDVVFSPDGRLLAAAGFHMDKIVGVYEVQTGKRVLALDGQTEWEADATVFSHDGKLLASTATDKQVLVWELATGKLRHQLKIQPYRLAALAFSPESATLAGGGGDRQIRFWDMQSGELRGSLAGHRDWIATLAFSPSGKTIASGSCNWGFHRGHGWKLPAGSPAEQSEWRLWEVDSGKLLRTVSAEGRLLCVAISPGGTSLACGVDKEVRLYDLAGEGDHRVVTSHDATVTSVAFTPDGEAITSGSHDQTLKRTNLASGKVEWQAPGYFEQVNSVALSDDGSLLVTGSSDHRYARGKLEAAAKHIGPGAVRLWDAKTSRMLRRMGEPTEQVMAVAISADGRRVAAGGAIASGGFVNVWDAATGKLAWSTREPTKEVLAVSFSTDGRWLAAGAVDGLVTIHDAQTGSIARTLADHKGGVTSLTFSRDGATLVCGEAHGGARIWNAQTGQLVHACPASSSDAESFTIDRLMNSIGLSRDGTTLAVCASSVNNEFVDAVRIWDVRTGKVTRDFVAEKIHGRPMALSPDGSIVATGGKTVKLWDVRSGTMLRELFGHLKRTQSIVFSADGRLVYAGGSYGTTNVWDVASGRHLITLFAFAGEGPETSADDWLAYTPEGYYDGSPGIERYLAWRVGDELVTAKTLGAQLHRADRIQSALGVTSQ
jgi:WD40 repeat protein